MQEKMILSDINDRELSKSLAIHGQGSFNVRFFDPVSLAKEALLRKGVVIRQPEISSIKQDCVIYDFLKDIDYFKDCNFEDAKNVNNAINYARRSCRGDEETKIVAVFSDGEFVEKNKAILAVYQKYKQYLLANDLTDKIEIINLAINEAENVIDEIIVFDEMPLEPLEEKLMATVSKAVKKQTIREYANKRSKDLKDITYASAYGSVNEVEYILGYIARNKIPYEDCTIALIDESYISQFISYRDTYKIMMSFGTGIPLSFSNAYKVLILLDRWNKGYNGYDSLNDLINAPEFITEKLFGEGFSDRDKEIVLKTVGNMRISTDRDGRFSDKKNILQAKKEIDRVEFVVNELQKGYSYLIKTYTRNNTGELENKAINTICSYLDEYFASVKDGTLSDVINELSNKKIAKESSKTGCIHITDLKGALCSIRKHLFICGLNANSFPGSPTEDYLLLDSDLMRFAERNIRNSINKISFNKKLLFDVLATASAFNEKIHLSYSGYSLSGLKTENPSSLLFEIYKKEHGPESKMADLENAIGEQHKYFDEEFTNLRNIGNKYLNGVRTIPFDVVLNECSSASLTKMISPSTADIFFSCPRRFYLTQILGIYEDQTDDPFNALPASDEGSLIHSCMEDLGNNQNWTKNEFMNNAEKKLDDHFKKRIPVHTNGLEMIKRNYLAMAEYAYDSDKHKEVYKSEAWLRYKDPDTGLLFGGRVDRIEKLENGKYLIVDYKTSRNIDHVKDDIDTCFQTVLYSYLLENSEHKQVEGSQYRYLRSARIVDCAYDDMIKKQLHDKLSQIRFALDNGYFPCASKENQSIACKYCSLGNICGKNEEEIKEAQVE